MSYKSLHVRLMIVSMMVYFALFAIILYGVTQFAGILWATTWADVPMELVEQIRQGARLLVLSSLRLCCLSGWGVLGSSRVRFAKPFRDLSQTALTVEDTRSVDIPERSELLNKWYVQLNSRDYQTEGNDVKSLMSTIRSNDEKFRSIVSNQRELIFRWKPDYSLTFVNQAFCEFFMRSEEILPQYTVGDILRSQMFFLHCILNWRR